MSFFHWQHDFGVNLPKVFCGTESRKLTENSTPNTSPPLMADVKMLPCITILIRRAKIVKGEGSGKWKRSFLMQPLPNRILSYQKIAKLAQIRIQSGGIIPNWSLDFAWFLFLWRAVFAGFSRRHSGLCREERRQKTPSQDGKQAKIFKEWSNDRFGLNG